MSHALAAAVLVFLAAAVYAADLRRRPERRCPWCKGRGRVAGSTEKRFGRCKHCYEKPPRYRLGAQLVRPGLRRRK